MKLIATPLQVTQPAATPNSTPPATTGQAGTSWRGTLPVASSTSSTALMAMLISAIARAVSQSPLAAVDTAATKQK